MTMPDIDTVNDKIATRLAALMAFKNVSQAEVGAAIGSDARRVRRILGKEAEATIAEIALAARFLGVKTSVVVGEMTFTDPAASV